MSSSSTLPTDFEDALEIQQSRRRSQLPALPEAPHAREVLVREGWLAARWLRSVLGATPAPTGPLAGSTVAQTLAPALADALRFEQAFEHSAHLDNDCDAQRVRVAQELVWALHSLQRQGLAGTPRRLLVDLLERAEDLFGQDQGPLDVATPRVEPPMSAAERQALIKGFSLVGAVAAGALTGALSWRTGLGWHVVAACLACGVGTALVMALVVPSAKEDAHETKVSGR